MSNTTTRLLLPAIAAAFALNLHAEPAWTTGSCAPAEWSALAGNLLSGLTGTISGAIATGYSTNDPDLLTNGEVPSSGGNQYRVGFQNNASISWTFAAPKTVESVRVSCGYLDSALYSGFKVASVEVQAFGASEWTALTTAAESMPNNGKLDIMSLTLADGGGDPLASAVGALRVTFGTPPIGFANYCVEIEAAGFAEATGPVIGALEISATKTKATLSGTIADVGTDATSCDIYLALGDAAARKIAEGVTGAFEYQLKNLAPGTAYAYTLSVSNNAPTAKGTVRGGEFTTLAADAQTASWSESDVIPAEWMPLSGNLLTGLVGAINGATAGSNYATSDTRVLTDNTVPSAGGAAYIVGFQNNSSIEWAFEKPMTLKRIRLSACYLGGFSFSRLAVAGISVKLDGSDVWSALDVPSLSDTLGRNSGVVICASLSDFETGLLAEDAVGLKIAFGNPGALASYCAEIEAVGHPSVDPTIVVFH